MAQSETPMAKARRMRKHLVELSEAVTEHLAGLDAEMAKPSTVERGKRIAVLASSLDMANDRVRYFALDVDYRTDVKEPRGSRA